MIYFGVFTLSSSIYELNVQDTQLSALTTGYSWILNGFSNQQHHTRRQSVVKALSNSIVQSVTQSAWDTMHCRLWTCIRATHTHPHTFDWHTTDQLLIHSHSTHSASLPTDLPSGQLYTCSSHVSHWLLVNTWLPSEGDICVTDTINGIRLRPSKILSSHCLEITKITHY